MDYDYVTNLSEEEKAFLNKFSEEYYGAALDVKNLDNNLHNTAELKKDCQDRNNARNRCIYSIRKAQGRLIDLEKPEEKIDTKPDTNPKLYEEYEDD